MTKKMPPPNPQTKLLQILVVDDDEDMVASLQDILQMHGHEVQTAYSGEEAIRKVEAAPPDCLLMDIRMPGLNGVDAYRRIKLIAPDSFVIFMTAFSASELLEEARREGAVELVPRPRALDRVLAVLDEPGITPPILVVDDESERSIAEQLAAHTEVHYADDVDQAIEYVEKATSGVVLLRLPQPQRQVPQGLLVFKKLHPRTMIVLMDEALDLRDDTYASAACLTKPFEIEDLVQALQVVAARRPRPSVIKDLDG